MNTVSRKTALEKQSATGIPRNCVVKKPHSIAEEIMLATALGTVPAIINGKLSPLLRYLEGPIEKPLIAHIHCVTSRFIEDKKAPKKDWTDVCDQLWGPHGAF